MDVVNRDRVPSFITVDGSEIRELMAYRNSCIANQSLAEAIVKPGNATTEHYHPKAEEIYYIMQGSGVIRIGEEKKEVGVQDAVAIPPGMKHKIWNTGVDDLIFLCCCAPCYEHTDTVLTEETTSSEE
ncbi:MAG: cupin domain-containing protein [Verrucomicrobiota bacterium]